MQTTLLWCTNFTPIHINDTFWKALYETLHSWRDFLHKTLLSPLTNKRNKTNKNQYIQEMHFIEYHPIHPLQI